MRRLLFMQCFNIQNKFATGYLLRKCVMVYNTSVFEIILTKTEVVHSKYKTSICIYHATYLIRFFVEINLHQNFVANIYSTNPAKHSVIEYETTLS